MDKEMFKEFCVACSAVMVLVFVMVFVTLGIFIPFCHWLDEKYPPKVETIKLDDQQFQQIISAIKGAEKEQK